MILIIVILVTTIILRMLDLAVIEQDFLKTQSDARVKRVLTLPAYRGMITDREGHPLAISASVYSVWMNPQEVSLDSKQIKILTEMLKVSNSHILKLIKRYQDTEREFVYLKRDI